MTYVEITMAVETIINETVPQIPVLADSLSRVHGLVSMLNYIMGGIFGLYLIFIILQIREARKMTKLVKEIREAKEIRSLLIDIRDELRLQRMHRPKSKR